MTDEASEDRTAALAYDRFQDLQATLNGTYAFLEGLGEVPGSKGLKKALDVVSELVSIEGESGDGYIRRLLLFGPLEALEELTRILREVREGRPSEALYRDISKLLYNRVDAIVESFLSIDAKESPIAILRNFDVRNQLRRVKESRSVAVALDRVDAMQRDVEAQKVVVDKAASQAVESARNATEIVGDAADGKLSANFSAYSKRQEFHSWAWSLFAAIALAVSVVLTWFILRPGDFGVDQVGRLAIALPLFATAVYAARVAGHHRSVSHWAAAKAVRLQTIGAYSGMLPEPEKAALRFELGRQVFVDAEMGIDAATPVPTVLEEPLALLDRAVTLLKSGTDAAKVARQR